MDNVKIMSKLQKWIFNSIFIPLTMFMLFFEYNDLYDSALFLYGYAIIFSFTILVCWIYWFYKSKIRSVIFIVNGLLISSIFLIKLSDFFARYMYVHHPNKFEIIISTDWWAYRLLPEVLTLLWLASWIISRLFTKPEITRYIYEINGEKLPIFVVEHEYDVLNIIVSSIKNLKFYCTKSLDSYQKVYDFFRPGLFVCALIDLNLEETIEKGIEVIKYIRSLDPNIYIVVVSDVFEEIYDEALLLAADDFILKPFDIKFFQLKIFLWTVKYQKRYERLGDSDFNISESAVNVIIKKIINTVKPNDEYKELL